MSDTATAIDLDAILDPILALPVGTRQVIADLIQASLHEDADDLAVPDFHRRIIEQRLKEEDENPSEGESWESLRARIERK